MVIRTSYTITRGYRWRCCLCSCSKSNQWGSIRAIRYHFDYIKPFLSLPAFIFSLRCHVFRIISYIIILDTCNVFVFCRCCCFFCRPCAALPLPWTFVSRSLSPAPVFVKSQSRNEEHTKRGERKCIPRSGYWTRSIFIIIVSTKTIFNWKTLYRVFYLQMLLAFFLKLVLCSYFHRVFLYRVVFLFYKSIDIWTQNIARKMHSIIDLIQLTEICTLFAFYPSAQRERMQLIVK